MGTDTRIEWTSATWSPVTGCTPISEGCAGCYAKRMANRLRGRCGYPADDPFAVTFHENRLEEPLKWRKPRHIFVCSMGDLFHEGVRFVDRCKIFNVFYSCPQHTFQVLTKRPEKMAAFIKQWGYGYNWPIPNVWLGVTAENQRRADERIPVLLQIPAAVRFVSYEPALEEIDFRPWLPPFTDCDHYAGGCTRPENVFACTDNPEHRPGIESCKPDYCVFGRRGLDWLIAGAETGPRARPAELDWFRSARDQCAEAGVPFFFKKDSQGRREFDAARHEARPEVER